MKTKTQNTKLTKEEKNFFNELLMEHLIISDLSKKEIQKELKKKIN